MDIFVKTELLERVQHCVHNISHHRQINILDKGSFANILGQYFVLF